jgi:hypothetical protein
LHRLQFIPGRHRGLKLSSACGQLCAGDFQLLLYRLPLLPLPLHLEEAGIRERDLTSRRFHLLSGRPGFLLADLHVHGIGLNLLKDGAGALRLLGRDIDLRGRRFQPGCGIFEIGPRDRPRRLQRSEPDEVPASLLPCRLPPREVGVAGAHGGPGFVDRPWGPRPRDHEGVAGLGLFGQRGTESSLCLLPLRTHLGG